MKAIGDAVIIDDDDMAVEVAFDSGQLSWQSYHLGEGFTANESQTYEIYKVLKDYFDGE